MSQDDVRLRTTLANGATVFAERVPGAKSLAISITANARYCPETPKTNGLRHLLEHLMARGPKLDVDHHLESVGGFLSARTTRETIQFSIVLPPEQFELGLRTAFDVLATPNPTPERIKKEAQVVREELRLEDSPKRFSRAAWVQLGAHHLDAAGDPDVMDAATREELIRLYKAQFDARNLVIAVAGDIDVDVAVRAAAKYLQVMPQRDVVGPSVKPEPKREVALTDPGYALAVRVAAFNMPQTAHVLAAGLALASQIENSYCFYTPSAKESLVIVGTKTDGNDLRTASKKADPRYLFFVGKQLAQEWLKRQQASPEAIADFRGTLACLQVDFRPDRMAEALEQMTLVQFTDALHRFNSDNCLEVIGR